MKSLIAIPLLFLSLRSIALESVHFELVAGLPSFYQMVKNCGDWNSSDGNGYRRVIVTDAYRGVGSELYVQSIKKPTQEKDAEVVKTIKISELNDDHSQYTIKKLSCQYVKSLTYISIEAEYEHDEVDVTHQFLIKIDINNNYKLFDKTRRKK